MREDTRSDRRDVIGFDLGDRWGVFCVLNRDGRVRERGKVSMTQEAIRAEFESREAKLVVIEVGTHSLWVERVLVSCGHTVIVANARQLPLIYGNNRKSDGVDAENLARLGRADTTLLRPIEHRSAESQVHLTVLRSRDELVGTRTKLVNHVRGVVKASGCRISSCSTPAFAKTARKELPEELHPALIPAVEVIELLTKNISAFDKKIEALAEEHYPVTRVLTEIKGVGCLTALAFVLALQDSSRFKNSRSAGAFLGLVPRQKNSGTFEPELRISKAGDPFVRRLLVQCAQYMLGHFGEDCDLRRWGLRLCERGGKKAKKRAVVAVARKLAVLLHYLWKTGEVYDPLHNAKRIDPKACA